MKTRLASKGQIVLPASARRRLGLVPGTEMEVVVEDNRLVLTPQRPRRRRFLQGTSEVSGLPVLEMAGDAVGTLTSAQVEELLSDFP